MTKPFEVASADVSLLNDIQLTQLLKVLLHAEAYRFNLAQSGVEVALNITTSDDGEDGRMSWQSGPHSTDFIPNRLTLFQNKAMKMGPTAYGKEVIKKTKKETIVKPQIDEILSNGGSYIVFTTQELGKKQKKARIKKIRDAITELKKDYASTCDLRIYDASQIAGWVNVYIPAIVAVQHWIGRPFERGLKTFDLWREHEDLSLLPYAQVASREDLLIKLQSELPNPKSCFRMMGLSGLGKTRTAFQVFVENYSIRNLVVYVDANHAPTIDALVADWVSLGFNAILVVDNCEYRLHERLGREVRREGSQISLLTMDYNFDSVSAPTISLKLEQMKNDELLQLLRPVYQDQLQDLDRIVSFAQGFPQMAVLLAEARLNEDPRIGELDEDEIANKLLWRRGEAENLDYLNILQVCSLFDVFGIEKEVEVQLEYIAALIGIDVDAVYACVKQFSDRGLIDRRGRFGQVVPKPLAIRLAGQWWTKTREQKQKDLIDEIPAGMVEGFCRQVEKMDFHTNVKTLTENLCGPQAPFGQAEVILSNRGSRLFRAFVNVNPEATSTALYKTLSQFEHHQLLAIEGEPRRNLVWALERLCFHAHLFEEAAWCTFLLASAETETWSNNATGIFAQLFRVGLSGTAAEPSIRFNLLKRAFELNRIEVDCVILEALKQAINTYPTTRTAGAEYQGTKAPFQEWRPTVWQEIFDFWQEAFDMLLQFLERGNAQKEIVVNEIGHSIRGFIDKGRIDMLDKAIRKIVKINGVYWPAALDSIKSTFLYDKEQLRKEAIDALNSWLELLKPENSDITQKLKILVIDPPYEHRKGDDGHYIDVAAENAKTLAVEIAKDVHSLFPPLGLLMQGPQKQSHAFGKKLAIELSDCTDLLKETREQFVINESVNPSFVLGIYSGIYEKSPDIWQLNIDELLDNQRLIVFYPEFICTGKIEKLHLDKLVELIEKNLVSYNSANTLMYGSVTANIEPKTIADFCLKLSALGPKGAWVALNIIFMYCFNNKESIKQIYAPIKKLVISVPLSRDQKETHSDIYHWHDMAKAILKSPDNQFAASLAKQIIVSSQYGFDYGDIWSHIKPLLIKLMKEYGELLWPIFGNAILDAEGSKLYWLQYLFDKENSFSNQQPSALSVLPIDTVTSWCLKNPDIGPYFVAGCVNITEETVEGLQRPTPLFIAILENFGDDDQVRSALASNMIDRGWVGSLVPYLEADKNAIKPLLEHDNPKVTKWVKEEIAYIDKRIKHESGRDDEFALGIY